MTTADLLALDVDWDIATGKVNVNGHTIGAEMLQPNLQSLLEAEGTEFAIAEMTKGDERPVDVRLLNDGRVIEPDLTSLRYAIKEFDTGVLYALNAADGTDVVAVEKNGQRRYRVPLRFDSAQMLQILQKYADPLGTFTDVITEMQLTASYKTSQTAAVSTEPKTVDLQSGATNTQSVYIPLGLEDGETKEFTTTVTVENRMGDPLELSPSFGDVRNIQRASREVTFTASKTAGAVSIDSGGSPASPLVEFTQMSPNLAPYPVWMDSVEFQDFVVDGENARIDAKVITEVFDHPALSIPANAWAADLKLPYLAWDFYGDEHRSDAQQYEVHVTNSANLVWSDVFKILLVDSNGDEQVALTLDSGITNDVTISELVSTAFGDFYLMGGVFPVSASTPADYYTTYRILFPTEPSAVTVRLRFDTSPDRDFAIAPVTIGNTAPVRLSATQVAEADPEEAAKTARLSTSAFVTRLRRDLNPDVVVDSGSDSG